MQGGAGVARERATSLTVSWDPHTERTTAATSELTDTRTSAVQCSIGSTIGFHNHGLLLVESAN